MKLCTECSSFEADASEACGNCEGSHWRAAPLVDGRYEVLERVGEGGMGVVYRAVDVGLGRTVALKLIHKRVAQVPQVIERFKLEARALARLDHPHVVRVYAFGEHDGSYFFAMEYVAGKNLDDLVMEQRSSPPLDPRSALSILRRVASGLGAVHARGLLHRDVKPSNIVIEESTGRPVLIDFGLAFQPERGLTEPALSGGTPLYMPPEQADAGADPFKLSPASDLYAFGCVAFELLTGRPVFDVEDLHVLLHMHANIQAPLISTRVPTMGPLDSVLARCLAKRPEDRFATADALLQSFDDAAASLLRGTDGATEPPVASNARITGDASALRVLIVDDDESFRQFLASAVEVAFRPGAVISTAARSGVEALERFEEQAADLVILDFDMPRLDGLDTLSLLRMLPRGGDASVLVVSAVAGDAVRWRFSRLGVKHFARKPLPLASLVTVLQRMGVHREASGRRSTLAAPKAS